MGFIEWCFERGEYTNGAVLLLALAVLANIAKALLT